MTSHYARRSDQTVRRRREQATKVNIKGEQVAIDPADPLAQAQLAKTRYGLATQTLPHGYCGLPVQKSCPHPNACLTCPVFLTGPEFLPELREHRGRTLTHIQDAEHAGRARIAEMNRQVLTNLDRMIDGIGYSTGAASYRLKIVIRQPDHGLESGIENGGQTVASADVSDAALHVKAAQPGHGLRECDCVRVLSIIEHDQAYYRGHCGDGVGVSQMVTQQECDHGIRGFVLLGADLRGGPVARPIRRSS